MVERTRHRCSGLEANLEALLEHADERVPDVLVAFHGSARRLVALLAPRLPEY